MGAAAQHPHGQGKETLQRFRPLGKEIDGGDEDQGRTPDRGDGQHRQDRFAAARGQGGNAPGARLTPQGERLLLMGPGRDLFPELPRSGKTSVVGDLIGEGDPVEPERHDGRRVIAAPDRKSTRLNSSHLSTSRMPSSA